MPKQFKTTRPRQERLISMKAILRRARKCGIEIRHGKGSEDVAHSSLLGRMCKYDRTRKATNPAPAPLVELVLSHEEALDADNT